MSPSPALKQTPRGDESTFEMNQPSLTIINHHEQSLIIINHQHHWQLVLDLRVLKEQTIGDDFLNKLNQFVC